MQGKKQLAEKLFLSFQLSDRVPEGNFYRRLKQTLDFQWLYKRTAKYYGTEGQESIDPVVFFKLMLVIKYYLSTLVMSTISVPQILMQE